MSLSPLALLYFFKKKLLDTTFELKLIIFVVGHSDFRSFGLSVAHGPCAHARAMHDQAQDELH